jgi:RHS repeat-associated protein
METNENGQVISYEEYHPFGTSAYRVARSGTDLSLKRYRFTNKERDDETGLYYFGVRYYAAWLGRWTSSDPGGFVDGLNMYVYVRNNPVNGVDEKGYSTDSIHLDKNGKEIARYEDGDDNTYQHDDIDLSQQHVDGARSALSTDFDLNQDTSRGGKELAYYSGEYNVVEGKGLVPIAVIGAETVVETEVVGGVLGLIGTGVAAVLMTFLLVLVPQSTGGPDAEYFNKRRDFDSPSTGVDSETETDQKPKGGGDTGTDDDDEKEKYSVYITLRDVKATANMNGESHVGAKKGKKITSDVDQPLYYVGISINEKDRYGSEEMQNKYMEVAFRGLTKDQARGVEQWIIELNTNMVGYPATSENLDNILNSTSPSRIVPPNDAYTRRKAAGLAVLNLNYPDWQERFNFSIGKNNNNSNVKNRLDDVDRLKYSHLYKNK